MDRESALQKIAFLNIIVLGYPIFLFASAIYCDDWSLETVAAYMTLFPFIALFFLWGLREVYYRKDLSELQLFKFSFLVLGFIFLCGLALPSLGSFGDIVEPLFSFLLPVGFVLFVFALFALPFIYLFSLISYIISLIHILVSCIKKES